MLYIGCMGIIFGAFLVWREYCSYLSGRVLYSRAFLGAVCDLREKMKCYLDTPKDWAMSYEDELLDECGFLDRLREGEDFRSAYGYASEKISVNPRVDEILSACFMRLGAGYIDSEIALLDSTITALSGEAETQTNDAGRKKRAVGAILGACASGIVILVI